MGNYLLSQEKKINSPWIKPWRRVSHTQQDNAGLMLGLRGRPLKEQTPRDVAPQSRHQPGPAWTSQDRAMAGTLGREQLESLPDIMLCWRVCSSRVYWLPLGKHGCLISGVWTSWEDNRKALVPSSKSVWINLCKHNLFKRLLLPSLLFPGLLLLFSWACLSLPHCLEGTGVSRLQLYFKLG